MKRKKSFLAGLCTLILAVTLTFGGFSGYTPVRAAETDFVLDDVKIQSTVSYGDTISVPEKTGFDVTVKRLTALTFPAETRFGKGGSAWTLYRNL